jgi:hypothetical protein
MMGLYVPPGPNLLWCPPILLSVRTGGSFHMYCFISFPLTSSDTDTYLSTMVTSSDTDTYLSTMVTSYSDTDTYLSTMVTSSDTDTYLSTMVTTSSDTDTYLSTMVTLPFSWSLTWRSVDFPY